MARAYESPYWKFVSSNGSLFDHCTPANVVVKNVMRKRLP